MSHTNAPVAELITHMWCGEKDARRSYPRGEQVLTVGGDTVVATRYEATTHKGQAATAVYGIRIAA